MWVRSLVLCSLFLATSATAQTVPVRPGTSAQGLAPDVNSKRPIAARDSLWIEELTWMEVRDALADGKTTVIVPTGGVEQNGPYVAAGKHNFILRATGEAIARKLGNALVAPIVPFVPEGEIEPATGHMRYPSTIGVEEQTFRALLRDIARSLRAHGFRTVIFIGDSYGNQPGLKAVAEELDASWRGGGARAIFIPEYYDWERLKWLQDQGFREVDQGFHDDLGVEAIIMTVDPHHIRLKERQAAGLDSINGVSLTPADRMVRTGEALVDRIADVTVAAIQTQVGH